MPSHTCIPMPNDTIVNELVLALTTWPIFKFHRNSTMPTAIAQLLASHCNGSASMVRLRMAVFELLENDASLHHEMFMNHTWFETYCSPLPQDLIYQVAFDFTVQDPLTSDLAMAVMSWTFFQRGEDLNTFLASPQLDHITEWFGNTTPLQKAALILSVCRGLVSICIVEPCSHIFMNDEVRNWIRENRYEQFTANETENMHLAIADMKYIIEAYETHGNAPCPDDASMEALLLQYPRLEEAAEQFPIHIRNAHQVLVENLEIMDQLILTIGTTEFLSCLKQIQEASNQPRLKNWSQRFPKKVNGVVWAASENMIAFLRYLIDNDPRLLEVKGSDDLTPLAAAATMGNKKSVAYLIGKGANLEARDLAGDTPLALASSYGHLHIIDLLVRAGANVNSCADDFATPLIIAASNDETTTMRALECAGANSSYTDQNGETSLSHNIRNTKGDLSYFIPDDSQWSRLSSIDELAYKALCRAMYASESRNAKLFEPCLPHAPGSTKPLFGYIPGELRRQYVLKRELGRGAFSTCVLAKDRFTGRDVAIKGSQLYQSIDPKKARHRHRNEMEELNFLLKLKHDNVMSLQDYFDEHGYVYMVFEVADSNLTKYLERNAGRMSHDHMADMMHQLLSGVKYLHDNNIIHCDIKPDNILVLDGGRRFMLTDLGNSQVVLESENDDKEKNIEDCPGTPSFMAPEAKLQFKRIKYRRANASPHIQGPPVDVFALGTVFFEAFVYKYIFDNADQEAMTFIHDDANAFSNPGGISRVQLIKSARHLVKRSYYWQAMPWPFWVLIKGMTRARVRDRLTVDMCLREAKAIPERFRTELRVEARFRQKAEEEKLNSLKIAEETEKKKAAERAKGPQNGRKKNGKFSKKGRKELRQELFRVKKNQPMSQKARAKKNDSFDFDIED